ncbi:hypothetical protein, partial [Bacillus altitudinis]|uniref:hypothetical protein n=1 Tax=Bacillus altitudinis TaxID=293387 RepID=UPI001C92DE84
HNILEHQNNFKNLTTSLSQKYHQYTFNPHQQKLPKLGLTPSQITQPIPPQTNQTTLTKLTHHPKQLHVNLQTQKHEYNTKKHLHNKNIT